MSILDSTGRKCLRSNHVSAEGFSSKDLGCREATASATTCCCYVTRVCRIAHGDVQQRGCMLPNVRLMIAALLVSVVALSCGFGTFAVFRVSHEPFAHLPAPMMPPQLVAENAAPPLRAHEFRGGEMAGRRIDSPLRVPEDATSELGAFEIRAAAYAEEPQQKTVPDAFAAAVLGSPAPIDTQDRQPAEPLAAIDIPAQQPAAPSVTVSELPPLPQSGDRADNPAETSVHDRPAGGLTAAPPVPPTAANEAPVEQTPAAAPSDGAPSIGAEAPPPAAAVADLTPPTSARNPEAEPAPTAAAENPEAADRVALETPPDFPLPRERPSTTSQEPLAPVLVRRPIATAIPPKHPRILIRVIHAPRFASAYYVRMPYAQPTDQGYAYGQAGEAQEQVVRRVARPRLAVRRLYPATARSQ
jgi:hypothetical protein